jgi:hypothetical protein
MNKNLEKMKLFFIHEDSNNFITYTPASSKFSHSEQKSIKTFGLLSTNVKHAMNLARTVPREKYSRLIVRNWFRFV